MKKPQLSGIFIYPIKSISGVSLTEAFAGERGLKHDRRWMLIDDDHRFISQRKYHDLALIALELKDDYMVLSHRANGKAMVEIPLSIRSGKTISASVWDDMVTLWWPNLAADEWLSELLHTRVRLVYMPDHVARQIDPKYVAEEMNTSLSDGYPYLLASQSSIDDVSARAGQAMEVGRFRPNLLVQNAQAFAEDDWKKIQVGEVIFRIVKPCARCVLTTIDPATGQAGKEPLRTLSTYRQVDNKILFGQNMIAERQGMVRLGDEIIIT
ncbi:MAG: MOSC domain-containing protein [Cyclobacteriaceae bacterium]|nr:MOSC domain-containing protein [Cyclobacteriaceae bacterium]